MTKSTSGAPRRPKRQKQRFTKKSVLKMLTVMSENGNGEQRDPVQDFLTTGRAGRRNALPNILSDHAMTTTADLPERLMGLTTNEKKDGNEELPTTRDEKKDNGGGSEASGSSSS